MAIDKKVMRIALMLMILFSLVACERRPLVDPSERVRVKVVVKVKNVLNVTTGIYNDRIPAPSISPNIMRVIFFDPETGAVATQAFIAAKGIDAEGNEYLEGNVSVLPGHYDMMCYNFDTPSTLIKDDNNWNSIMAYTREIDESFYTRFKSKADANAPLIYHEPDHLVLAREHDVVIPNHSELITIHTEAHSIIDSYYIQIRLVNGKYASNASAVLTDVSPSVRLGDNERTQEHSGIYFEMQRSIDPRIRTNNQDVLCAVFNTFGKLPAQSEASRKSELFVSFNIITATGEQVEMTVDMDSIFQTEDAIKRHWLLIDKELVIPKPGGAFQPSAEGWDILEGVVDI